MRSVTIRRVALGWTLAAAALVAAACDQGPTSVRPAPQQQEESRFYGGEEARRLLTPTTPTAPTAAEQKLDTTFWKLNVTSRSPGVDTTKIVAPNGDTIKVRRFGASAKQTIVVGQDTFVFEIGVWENGSGTGGDFMGLIWKNGVLTGFWGHCTLKDNAAYIVTDPATGKKTVHWVNTNADGTVKYHYVFDPSTGKLTITETRDGVDKVIYDAKPPLTNPNERPATTGWPVAAGPTPATTTDTTATAIEENTREPGPMSGSFSAAPVLLRVPAARAR